VGAESVLLLVDLGRGKNRMGGSILAQTLSQTGSEAPDVDSAADLRSFWEVVQSLGSRGLLIAYHDRSDGGLAACAAEMAFAGHAGVEIDLPQSEDAFASLFSEELGAVLQVSRESLAEVAAAFDSGGLKGAWRELGVPLVDPVFRVRSGGALLLEESLVELRRSWSRVTHQMARLRDNPDCADQEAAARLDWSDPGMNPHVPFSIEVGADYSVRPPMAILREQGVNGEVEMAAAFTRAGFRAVDVHMSDILAGRISLADFRGLVACGGFSYGDVLGAGEGWAKSILFNDRARAEFETFFKRADTFALGICNGCQMMSNLHSIIPGADSWPRFVQNKSERFEARFASVRIEDSPSVLLAGMKGGVLPIAVAHGEGFAEFADHAALSSCEAGGLVAARFVDHHHRATEQYPLNPNGSPKGITALTSRDGRVTIMMPHPERVFRTVQHSWAPREWGEDAPWLRMFRNARAWVG
jgi:phosphoribosylformylglycinamidine synthase